MSFFQWLREGVRQAVVLGLADAVDDVGTRTNGEELGPALAQSLRDRLAVGKEPRVIEQGVGAVDAGSVDRSTPREKDFARRSNASKRQRVR